MFSRGARQTSSLGTLALGASFAVILGGCPGGSELENPQRFGSVFAGSPASVPMAGAGGAPMRLTECDYETILTADCATKGCHFEGAAYVPYEELSLMADATLATRLKDRPSRHGDIECQDHMPCLPAECPVGDFVVDSRDWTKSWLLGKITAVNGCGYPMPPFDNPFDPVKYACLEDMVQAIAALPK